MIEADVSVVAGLAATVVGAAVVAPALVEALLAVPGALDAGELVTAVAEAVALAAAFVVAEALPVETVMDVTGLAAPHPARHTARQNGRRRRQIVSTGFIPLITCVPLGVSCPGTGHNTAGYEGTSG